MQLHDCKSISASHPVLGLGNGPNNVRSRRRRCLPSLVLFAKRFIIHLLSSIHVCVWVFGAQAHLHPSASFWGCNPVVSRKQSAILYNSSLAITMDLGIGTSPMTKSDQVPEILLGTAYRLFFNLSNRMFRHSPKLATVQD